MHNPDYPSTPPSVGEAWDKCSLGVVEGCAETRPLDDGGDLTKIDAAFFRTLNDAQKAALIAHERAHSVIGLDCACEGCADKVGGFIMRSWGWTAPAVQDAMQHVAGQFRPDAGRSAFEGARKAESIVARGAKTSRGIGGILSLEQAAQKIAAAPVRPSRTAPPTKAAPPAATARTPSPTPVPATKPAGGGGTKAVTDPTTSKTPPAPFIDDKFGPPGPGVIGPHVIATKKDPAAPSFFASDLARDIAVGLVIAIVVSVIVK